MELKVRIVLIAKSSGKRVVQYKTQAELFSRQWDENFWDLSEVDLFTGKTDKNGADIYVNDIVRIDWKDERYKPVLSIVSWDDREAAFNFGAGTTSEVEWSHEVLGNLHENSMEEFMEKQQ